LIGMNKLQRKVSLLVFGALLVLLSSATTLAQHSHGVLTPGVTFPPDDSVLTEPPQMITMSFRVDVRLLKLALYTAEDEWINIDFQYDPSRFSHSFVLPIPGELPKSEYYIARWSVTDDRRGLVNGEFTFAFGSGAIPPSETIASKVSDRVEILPSTGSYRYQRPTN
jgi:methionine-rich copper-binding protein CopC